MSVRAQATDSSLRCLSGARFGTRLAACITVRLAAAGFRFVFLGSGDGVWENVSRRRRGRSRSIRRVDAVGTDQASAPTRCFNTQA